MLFHFIGGAYNRVQKKALAPVVRSKGLPYYNLINLSKA